MNLSPEMVLAKVLEKGSNLAMRSNPLSEMERSVMLLNFSVASKETARVTNRSASANFIGTICIGRAEEILFYCLFLFCSPFSFQKKFLNRLLCVRWEEQSNFN